MPCMKRFWYGVLLKLKGEADPNEAHSFRSAANLPFLPHGISDKIEVGTSRTMKGRYV